MERFLAMNTELELGREKTDNPVRASFTDFWGRDGDGVTARGVAMRVKEDAC